MQEAPAKVAERIGRESFGRLVAYLAARWRDVTAAEDALADALLQALESWPANGVPAQPEAWLLKVARNRLIDRARRGAVAGDAAGALQLLAEEAQARADAGQALPDERLKLLFVCAHPAVEPGARTPLMLQAVLGLDAARIASAFLVAPATMGQRLVRAKARIRESGIRFEVPEPAELAPRLDAVLEAIYAAYGLGWDDVAGGDPGRAGLTEQALWLGRLVAGLLPQEPEAAGLVALMLFCESRQATRRAAGSGDYVPLAAQDPAAWSHGAVDEAEALLRNAARAGRLGRFQLEAAIQSVHADRRRTGMTDWAAVARLYDGLAALSPAMGVQVGRAAALGEAQGPAAGLAALDAIDPGRTGRYQPYWAVQAHLLDRAGRYQDAQRCYALAAGLSEDDAVRRYLLARRAALEE